MRNRLRLPALAFAAALVAGCASNGPPQGQAGPQGPSTAGGHGAGTAAPVPAAQVRYGTVESVRELRRDSQGNWIPGALLGGVLGGVLGNQVGGGRGNDIATAAGAIGGAVIGGRVSRGRSDDTSTFEVVVRLDDASRVTLRQADVSDLQPGMRVLVDEGVARRL